MPSPDTFTSNAITMNTEYPAIHLPKAEADPEAREINRAFRNLMDVYLRSNHRRKVEIIEKAFRFALNAHRDMRRRNGEPYIMHPLAVATIAVGELGLGSTSICCALLHDVVANSDYTHDDILDAFGPKIASIVEGITRISGGILGQNTRIQAEKFRKLLLSMSTDVRVVLVKMADRLHNMRTLEALPEARRRRVADETLYVYAPLAHRLGLNKMKYEFEDLALRYLQPEVYAEIRSKVVEGEAERQRITEVFVEPVRRKLDEAGFTYEVKARVKSAYSIYNKMQKKGVGFDEVYDIY
ncbi:MAG: HD domain-containing protein, partial [Muribaculaceae bacterium]|nr:HD domain-containing protein [Muribaculaceae bacterium]